MRCGTAQARLRPHRCRYRRPRAAIPTFREAPDRALGNVTTRLNSLRLRRLHRDSGLVWRWYQLASGTFGRKRRTPNAGHLCPRNDSKHWCRRLTLVTQNVDGLHQHAQAAARVVRVARQPLRHSLLYANDARVRVGVGNTMNRKLPARMSSACGAPRLRPGVVWFGEAIPETRRWSTAVAAA